MTWSTPLSRRFLAATASVLLAASAQATTYHVAESGSDASGVPGTSERPLRTVQRALTLVTGGDTIYLRKGRHPGFDIRSFHKNPAGIAAKDAKWLTVSAYPGEHAVIDVALNKSFSNVVNAGALYGVSFSGASYVIVQDLEITDTSFTRSTCNPETDASCPCDLTQTSCQDRALEAAKHLGVNINSQGASSDNFQLILQRCHVHHHGGKGITGGGTGSSTTGANPARDIWILDNEISHNGVPGLSEGYGTYMAGTRFTVRGNVVHHNNGHGFRFANPEYQGKSHLRHSVIEGNFSYSNGGRWWHRSSARILENGAGIVLWGGHDNVIRNNIFVHNRNAGIDICGVPPWDAAAGAWAKRPSSNLVINNTVYGNGSYGILIRGPDLSSCSMTSDTAINNITYGNAARPEFAGRAQLLVGSLSTEHHNLIGINPLFAGGSTLVNPADFRIGSTSKARRAGVTHAQVTNDFFRDARPASSNSIGAHEYDATTSPQAPAAPRELTVQ